MKNEDLKKLLETQERTLKLIKETQESLRRSINKQDNRMDSLRRSMNVEFVILIIYIMFCSLFI